MNETVEIPVTYKGEELVFEARLVPTGYTVQIEVDVYGDKVRFEADEEQNYRAILDPEQIGHKKIDVELLRAIAAIIEEAVR
ncbi:hypothetical protein V9K67_17085 [Paraflavisolibacter sp. H34]|uniref:hypothetical protein n=1 Tax=Huijunlia imazamoxiresistens TaxID=3127457 RepID=UPI003018ED47